MELQNVHHKNQLDGQVLRGMEYCCALAAFYIQYFLWRKYSYGSPLCFADLQAGNTILQLQ